MAKKRILIAEDEEFIANLYKMNLEKRGVDIEIAGNGQQALAAIERQVPDLLILDLLMPDMDGFQVLQALKPKNLTLPIVILTNLSQDIDKQKCQEAGAKDFFVKSDLTVEDLWNKISKYL
jgi:DNA-binding response OmpR family regulator